MIIDSYIPNNVWPESHPELLTPILFVADTQHWYVVNTINPVNMWLVLYLSRANTGLCVGLVQLIVYADSVPFMYSGVVQSMKREVEVGLVIVTDPGALGGTV